MGPLGIITTIVSAIRVDGPPWLKAIIGRSRENLSAAEMELMSSTSNETCELWNGSDVVRCQGVAPVTEFICLVPKERGENIERIRFMDLTEAIDKGLVNKQDPNRPGAFDRLWTHCGWPQWGGGNKPAKRRNVLRRNWSRPKPADEEASTSIPLENVGQEDSFDSSPIQPPTTAPENTPELVVLRNTSTQAPNITLNRNHKAIEGQLLVAACFGIILQLGVLVYFAFITYYPTIKFKKNDKDVVGYAFPLASGGTVFLVLGMLLCAHVVDHSTEEERYEPSKDHMIRMIWLQEKQTISDQVFHLFALFPRRSTQVITTSQRKKKGRTPQEDEQEASMSSGFEDKAQKGHSTVRHRVRRLRVSQTEKTIHPEKQEKASINLCVIATLVCLMGFLVQFIGLRAMHWSASVGQLVAVIIMTIIRAWIRRGFTARMDARELRNGFELDGLALALGDPDLDKGPGSIADEKGVDFGLSKKRTWTVEIDQDEKSYPFIRQPDHSTTQDTNADALKSGLVVNRGTNEAQEILDIRRHLARLSQWQGPASRAANSLGKAIEVMMNTLCPWSQTELPTWKWTIRVAIHEKNDCTKSHPVELHMSHQNGVWKCRIDELDSVLSLWLCSIDQTRASVNKIQTQSKNDDDEWIRRRTSWAEGGLVLFGEYREQLEQALGWWMPADAPKLSIIDEKTKDGFDPWRIIGTESPYTIKPSTSRSNPVRDPAFGEEAGGSSAQGSVDEPEREPEQDSTSATKSSRQFLSIEVDDGLEHVYARHIFHAFISAAAAKMNSSIDDHSDMETVSNIIPGEWRNLRLRGKNLSRLAGAIRDSGLMGLNQAYLTIIPPLHAERRLGELDSVIEAVFTQAQQHQRLLDWKAAGKAYTALLDLVKTFHSDSYTFRKVVALADDYIRTLEALPADPESRRDEQYPQAADVKEALLSILDHDSYKVIRNDLQILHGYQQGLYSASGEVLSCNFTKLHSHAATPDTTDFRYILLKEEYKDELAKVESRARIVSDKLFMHVSGQDILGWTPLHYAATGKNIEAQAWINELLRKQADVNAVDIRHRTALHYAILNGNIDSFRVLLEANADITITGVDGMTPLHCAALEGSGFMSSYTFSRFRRQYLPIRHFQASIETKDLQDRTALHLATLSGHLETITELVRYKADPNARFTPFKCGGEVTALTWAIQKRKTKVIQRLIEAGADVNDRDHGLWTPLHHACFHGYADIVGVLIVNGALINSANCFKQTPLHFATYARQLKVVRRLLEESDIRLNIVDDSEKPAVQAAAENCSFDVVELLVRKGALIDDKTTLIVASGVKEEWREEDEEDEEIGEMDGGTGTASGKKSYDKAFAQQALSLWQIITALDSP
ncbi:hypothetical protein HG530_001596 [Fusarium avenaceum]|nr:hypothetical protein HG530_001596 [Fusarium avenaceum]